MRRIPNILSLLRIIVALAFPFLPVAMQPASIAFALFTEFFDGFLARRFKWESTVGQILDPVADKLFALTVCTTFLIERRLLFWQFMLISIRDAVVTIGFFCLILFFGEITKISCFKPNVFGKLSTAFQYFVFSAIVIYGMAAEWIIFVAGLFSILAGCIYVTEFIDKQYEKTKSIHL